MYVLGGSGSSSSESEVGLVGRRCLCLVDVVDKMSSIFSMGRLVF